jgi:hypothetical protein
MHMDRNVTYSLIRNNNCLWKIQSYWTATMRYNNLVDAVEMRCHKKVSVTNGRKLKN